MKIICIGRNFVSHIEELKNEIPIEPVVFFKPDTALMRNGTSFFIPEFSNEINYEIEIVLKIGKEGKYISENTALEFIDKITVGVDFTARDLQNKLKQNGLPWERAKAFDNSALVGTWLDYKSTTVNKSNLNFQLISNSKILQDGNTQNMIFNFEKIIANVSKFVTLKVGDLIFTGTPSGVDNVEAGRSYTGYLENNELFNFNVK
jgi:2-keto-4-pentenoate hydratase/2-oxohepta-3-ene-1,7-dioic acid hydratase in catechol pathway